MMTAQMLKAVTIDYTNWRGVRRLRRVIPMGIEFTSNEWHREPQWIMTAYDLEKSENRQFAMSEIRSWLPQPEDSR